MNGEQLYNQYRAILKDDHDVLTDEWVDLDSPEQQTWDKLAERCCLL
jgi:hypothetical protein